MSERIKFELARLPGVLEEELKSYLRYKEVLLDVIPDKFILIKGNELIAVADTEREVVAEGYQRFKDKPFLVKQVLEREVPKILNLPIITKHSESPSSL
jgi:hypothetical protein